LPEKPPSILLPRLPNAAWRRLTSYPSCHESFPPRIKTDTTCKTGPKSILLGRPISWFIYRDWSLKNQRMWCVRGWTIVLRNHSFSLTGSRCCSGFGTSERLLPSRYLLARHLTRTVITLTGIAKGHREHDDPTKSLHESASHLNILPRGTTARLDSDSLSTHISSSSLLLHGQDHLRYGCARPATGVCLDKSLCKFRYGRKRSFVSSRLFVRCLSQCRLSTVYPVVSSPSIRSIVECLTYCP